MKKYLFQQLWLLLCIVIMCLFVLGTAFNYSIVVDEETFELSEYCESEEKRAAVADKNAGSFIDYGGKKLEMYGVSSDSHYDPVSFLLDMGERIISNFRIFTLKNLFVFVLLFIFTASAFVIFVSGLIKGLLNIPANIKEIRKKDGEKKNIVEIKGTTALYAPLILWGCVEFFRIYNSVCLSSVFDIQNKITTVYDQGFNLLLIFIIFSAVYWIGRTAIKYLVKV